MGTNTGTIMTLANSIIGVSVLAMPFCFKQCGIALSILMLIASSLLSRLACQFLLKSAVMARRRTFEFLAFHTFGPTGKLAVELFIIGFLMGTCIAFFVVMGDLGPAIMAKILGLSSTVSLRPSVLIGLALFVVLPLGMLRNVDSLSSVSMATIGFYICLVLKVVGESLPHLLAGDWYEHVNFWRPAGILQCIPIFSMALFCQTQLFEIYESMHNASLDRMDFVIRAACNICTGVYICVGFFGYIAFCTQPFTGNVLMSFTPSIVSEMIKLGFVLSVAVSFPLVIFPCRASLYSLLFRRITMPHHEGVGSHIPEARFKCLTIFIISVTLVIGLLIPNIELVLGLVGSTIGVLICVMFPAAAFICMSTKSSNDRLLAQVLLFVGALILVLGTYATLNSANETKPSDIVINEPAAGSVEKSPHFHDKMDNSLADLPPKLERRPESDVKQFGEEPKQASELALDVKIPKPEQPEEPRGDASKVDKRQEPPIPVEPAGDLRQQTVASVIRDEKTAAKGAEAGPSKENIQKENPEKEVAKAEMEKKEMKSAGEQVDQDAIKKEDDELAEAEKRDDNAGNSKNEEILRKLEKHEAQQMQILEKQKQILQALQEHQERELFKDQQDHSAKNLNQTKTVETKETKVDIQINEVNKEVKEPVKDGLRKPDSPPAKKQDLLKKIANGELKKPIPPAPLETVASIKSYQPPERPNKTIQSDKNSFVAEVPVAKIQESLHVAAPDMETKPEAPVAPAQPLLLKRLKGQPLPLALHRNESKPLIPPASDNNSPQLEGGVNVMRREILQEPVVSTQTSIVQADVKNASVVVRDILSPPVGGELHDREKRDLEETEQTNVVVDTGDVLNKAGPVNINNEGTQLPHQENCHITEKSVSGEQKHSREMYKKPNQDDGDVPVMKLVNDDLSSHSLPPELAKAASVNVPQSAFNSSQVKATSLINESPAVATSNYSVPLKPASESNIENTMIKSATHLSDPKVKSNENNEVTVLRQGVSPDSKPMKRDLKSISLSEDKSTTPQKKGI